MSNPSRQMPMRRDANSSQAAWALLAEGVSAARLDVHRLRGMATRILQMVGKSPAKEHLYEVAGDLIQAVPLRIESIERHLDRTSYALAVMGEDHLRDRLPLADRKIVDESTERAKPLFGPTITRSAARVAARYVARRADLQPPLGWPGGPCHVIDRVRREVGNPRLREGLIDDIEYGDSWSNPEAAQVYDIEIEALPAGTRFKRLVLGPHGQFRMDLRGITVPQVRVALLSFFMAYLAEKSRGSFLAKRWEEGFSRSSAITWVDPKLRLTVVFAATGSDIKLVTTYWEGGSDAHPPGEGGCDI